MEESSVKNKTIIRVVHNRENPYAQLNKKSIWDRNLSLKAVGLWTRCLSRPDDWSFCISELVKRCKEGRKAVDSAMQELMEHGYVLRLEISVKDEKGKFCGKDCEFIFFECPATEEEKAEQIEIFKKSYAYCQKGNVQNGDVQNGELLIKSSTKTDKERTKKEESKPKKEAPAKAVAPPSSPSSSIPSKKIDRALHVRTSESEHATLVEKYGEAKTAQLYEHLSLWKQTQSEKDLKKLINGDYARINKWVVSSVKKSEIEQQSLNLKELQNKQIAERLSQVKAAKPNQRDLMAESLKSGSQNKELLSSKIYDMMEAKGKDMTNYEREGGPREAS